MNILIIASKKDKASVNLKKRLFENYNLEKKKDFYLLKIDGINNIYFKEIENQHIYSNEKEIVPKDLQVDQIIVLSKHSTLSEIKTKTITAHSIGNWGKAELGGQDKTLVKTDPILIREILFNLKKNKPTEIKEYEIKQEATHHGPYLNISTIFVEIGSSDPDWENKDVANYIIKTVINILTNYNKQEIKNKRHWVEALGIGGNHYCSKFNKKTFKKSNLFCFGHIIPNYALKDVNNNPKIIEEAKEKSNSEIVIYNKDL
jgi:D-aminoacyl-tRNA deacylase